LALAILADFLENDQQAVSLHQDFKWDVIAKLPYQEWELSTKAIESWLALRPLGGSD
jgi:hypothetical protein